MEKFGVWKLISIDGDWAKCKDDKDNIATIPIKLISIQNKKFADLKGSKFGDWNVLEYIGDRKWKCQCSCGIQRNIIGYDLKNGRTTSCGHNTTGLKDLKGITSGDFKVIEYVGDQRWLCECHSGTRRIFKAFKISHNLIGRCQCKSCKITREYFEKDKNISMMVKDDIHDYLLEIKQGINIITNANNIIKNASISFYLPEYKLAIDYSNTKESCTPPLYKKEHQNKTIKSIVNGIRLIQIFEYEWLDERKREILKNLLRSIILPENNRVIYARKTKVVDDVSNDEVRRFTDNNHLQGHTQAKIKLGLYQNSELLGIMTFDKPRFNGDYEYELIRLAWKNGVAVKGGAEKLFKYFINNYKPYSIVSYCDITKFTGNVYFRLGFKTSLECLTEPNYVWYSPATMTYYPRYKVMKHKLLAAGLGTPDQTEGDIMTGLGYYKIYDSGNMKFYWSRIKI